MCQKPNTSSENNPPRELRGQDKGGFVLSPTKVVQRQTNLEIGTPKA
jgi:hypothetical protein